jgi:hypothetical protein
MSNFQLQRRRVSKLKKFLAIILGAIFVLSFAASAFAIHAEIPSETQAVIAKGATQITLSGELRTRGWYQKNIVSGAPVESKSQAWYDQRVRLAVDAKVTPNVQGFVQLESGASNTSDVVTWGNFNSKIGPMTILQAWMLYTGQGLFGFPAGLKIGHMPLALGEKQFFDHTRFGDDAIVFFMDPTKELHVGLLAIKFVEGATTDNQDDLDGYVGLAVYKWDPKNSVGLNFTYLKQNTSGMKESNLGLHAGGSISGLSYKAEADFQFGDKAEGVKAKGYGLMLGLGYNVDPVGIRASAAYGSGDSDGTGEKQFDTFLSALQNYTLIYEYRVKTAANATATGISNTTYVNLGVDFAPMKDLKASLDGYLLRATKSNTAIAGSDSKDAGWEADAKVVYNVARNLTYQVDAGYFKAGDLYGADNKGVTVVRHMLTLSF